MSKKKLILKDFELTEISGVDRPAQPTAKMSIMKRADTVGTTDDSINKDIGVPQMSKELEDQVATLTKSVEQLTENLAKVEAEKVAAEAVAKLSDEEKAFISKMSDEDKEEYMKMSPEEKKKKMGAMKKNDETVVIDGNTISKAEVGDSQFAIFKSMAKRAEDAEARIAKAEQDASNARLEKRASDEFGNLSGKIEDKVATLSYLAKADENVREYVETIMKSANDFNKEATIEKGVKGGKPNQDVTKKYNDGVAEIMKRDNVSKSVAMETFATENPEIVSELS